MQNKVNIKMGVKLANADKDLLLPLTPRPSLQKTFLFSLLLLYASLILLSCDELGSGKARFNTGAFKNVARVAPDGIAFDADGNLYSTDVYTHSIYKTTPEGVISIFAGRGVFGSADGQGTAASFKSPKAIAFDKDGNMYVADRSNRLIRKITPKGFVSTFAGSGASGSADGQGTAASFRGPQGIAIDKDGNVYVADSNVPGIRKITSNGLVSTIMSTSITGASGVAADGNGNLYVAQNRKEVSKIAPDGTVSSVATGFSNAYGIAVGGNGNLYVTDSWAYRIYKVVLADGTKSVLAGSSKGFKEGKGADAQFSTLKKIAVGPDGNIYVADANFRIRKITPEGVASTRAGLGSRTGGTRVGLQSSMAQFTSPNGAAVAHDGSIYLADPPTNCIRKITFGGEVSIFAGGSASGFENGPIATASFNSPKAIAISASGISYVADVGNQSIRKIMPDGTVSTLATSATFFGNIAGITADTEGNVYVTDPSAHSIIKITAGGTISVLAGGSEGFEEGMGTVAKFSAPSGIAAAKDGNIYVADVNNHRIRKITPDGTVSTLAGSATIGSLDGQGPEAQFMDLSGGITVAADGNIYVGDLGVNSIRKITPSGTVSTVDSGSNIKAIAITSNVNATHAYVFDSIEQQILKMKFLTIAPKLF